MIRRLLSLFFVILIGNAFCFAEVIVDDSIHTQISRKYNLEDLPDLPANLQNSTVESIFTPNEFDTAPQSKYTPPTNTTNTTTTQTPPKTTATTPTPTQTKPAQTTTTQTTTKAPATTFQQTQTQAPQINYSSSSFEAVKINRGKKFTVVNYKALSDTMPKGTRISFISTAPETCRYITIPKNTVFMGSVIDSHSPNLTGNGGLLVIKVDKILYKGASYPINAKITIAKDKKIFFNNIKGKRMYWHNLAKKTNWGKKFYDKMWAKTKKHFHLGLDIIITPFTFISGTVVYAANIVSSPVLAIFTKGGKLTIPAKSHFEIKFLEDAMIYK